MPSREIDTGELNRLIVGAVDAARRALHPDHALRCFLEDMLFEWRRLLLRMAELQKPTETPAAPEAVLQWAINSFGIVARNRDERAARLVEEAIEIAQVERVPLEVLERILARVYSLPAGELGQEIGGCGITLLALAANANVDLRAEIEREWRRVCSRPNDWWRLKHAEKVAAGTADISPVKAVEGAA